MGDKESNANIKVGFSVLHFVRGRSFCKANYRLASIVFTSKYTEVVVEALIF